MAKGRNSLLPIPAKAVDPALDALFASSYGPIKAPPKSRYAELISPKPRLPVDEPEAEDEEDEEVEAGSGEEESSSEKDEEEASDDDSEEESDQSSEDEHDAEAEEVPEPLKKDRKRKKRQDDNDDLEGRYFDKLTSEDSPASKRRKGVDGQAAAADGEGAADGAAGSDSDVPVHESLVKDKQTAELDKANRTVFLSNVSTEAVKSKKAKKELMAHLSSFLDKSASPAPTLESLRFRSVPFATAAVPKRAAYITKSVMEATTRAANAYAVYSTPAAARQAVAKLNGTVVLDRHLRVDSVAHPMAVDHRRCVFVGNLGFVDDETVLSSKVDEEGKEKTEKRKRTRVPMDVEEGLWRTFGQHAGKVQSVRVVRDQATRVGLGIAYVQFYDGNAVESALLLNGKKFPPMLPRALRVSRCKAPHKTARAVERSLKGKVIDDGRRGGKPGPGRRLDGATGGYVRKVTAEEQTLAGRSGRLLGQSAAYRAGAGAASAPRGAAARIAARNKKGGRSPGGGGAYGAAPAAGTGAPKDFKTPEAIVFEGRRASARDGKPRDLKLGRRGGSHKKSDHGKKARGRGAAK